MQAQMEGAKAVFESEKQAMLEADAEQQALLTAGKQGLAREFEARDTCLRDLEDSCTDLEVKLALTSTQYAACRTELAQLKEVHEVVLAELDAISARNAGLQAELSLQKRQQSAVHEEPKSAFNLDNDSGPQNEIIFHQNDKETRDLAQEQLQHWWEEVKEGAEEEKEGAEAKRKTKEEAEAVEKERWEEVKEGAETAEAAANQEIALLPMNGGTESTSAWEAVTQDALTSEQKLKDKMLGSQDVASQVQEEAVFETVTQKTLVSKRELCSSSSGSSSVYWHSYVVSSSGMHNVLGHILYTYIQMSTRKRQHN